jgi:hypothetical protein
MLVSLVLPLAFLQCLLTANASDAAESILQTDNQGRLHIAASDVMILNTSFRGLLNQLQTLNTALRQEIQTLSQQVADLRQDISSKCACTNTLNSTTASSQIKLVASDGAAGDFFGIAVAATDSMVVVGAHQDDDKGSNSGSVYVFEKNSTGQYDQVSKLVASDGAAGDFFGFAVAATDGIVVVGARADDDDWLSVCV